MMIKNKILKSYLEHKSNKLFGIGLPKTGTTSLHKALNMLGIRTLHNPLMYAYANLLNIPISYWDKPFLNFSKDSINVSDIFPETEHFKNEQIKFDDWDAIVNFGEHIYPLLDKEFCNSKFILTVRDKESWLKSLSTHRTYFEPTDFEGCLKKENMATLLIKIHIFQSVSYNKDYFSILYDNHLRNVKHYFKEREQDLLILDVCGGDGWEPLCSFLEKDVPDVPFPHLNQTEQRFWTKNRI